MPHQSLDLDIPLDVVAAVAQALHGKGYAYTLAQLALASRQVYNVTVPWLYRDMVINKRARLIFELDEVYHLSKRRTLASQDVLLEEMKPHTRRRVTALGYVHRLTIASVPPDDIGLRLKGLVAVISSKRKLLFPRVTAVCLLPDTLDELALWRQSPAAVHAEYPPAMTAINKGCSPKHFCLSYRLVPNSEHAEYRHQTRGPYTLSATWIRALSHGWSLESATFHDLVWHDLPMMMTTNYYHFAPPPLPHPLFSGRWTFPTLEQELQLTHIAGPLWTERAEALRSVIYPLLKAAQEGRDQMYENVSWVFCGAERHLQSVLPISHPAVGNNKKHGMQMVRNVFKLDLDRLQESGPVPEKWHDRGRYEAAQVCQACGREFGRSTELTPCR